MQCNHTVKVHFAQVQSILSFSPRAQFPDFLESSYASAKPTNLTA